MKRIFLHPFNLKKVVTFLILMFALTASIYAQTPQYYNSNTGSSANLFPFNVAGGKAVNTLFLAGAFGLPTPLPPGQQITKVYFRMASAGTRTYTNLHILMAQDVITTLTSGTFYPGPWDTVFYHASETLTSTVGGWMGPITLDTAFPYDPTKSLIIFVGQCGMSGTGGNVYNTTLTPVKRVWSVGGCPFVPYSSGDGYTVDFGVDVQPAILYNVPELIYYKFENNPTPTSTPNYAIPGVGLNPATITGHTLTTGGMVDSCMQGTGGSGSTSYLQTGWNCNLGSGNWTIGFWVNNLVDLNPTYLWGDPGSTSFRCFYGGAALANNMLLRGPLTDILISCPMPGTWYFHFVYNGTNVLIYRNGTLLTTNPRTINMPTGTGFKVGAYSTSSYSMSGKMDEFRIYNRALTAEEIVASWNKELPILVGTPNINTQVPDNYSLSQNYPNPFNPATKISYTIPKAGKVKLVVFDVLGREVRTLVNDFKQAGSYTVDFDASSFASGVYLYRIEAGEFIDTKKMMFVK